MPFDSAELSASSPVTVTVFMGDSVFTTPTVVYPGVDITGSLLYFRESNFACLDPWSSAMSGTAPHYPSLTDLRDRPVVGEPSLKALADMLRSPEQWPRDFAWDFARFATCAVGLAALHWAPEDYRSLTFGRVSAAAGKIIARLFPGLSNFDVDYLFVYAVGGDPTGVSPRDIANRIDIFLRAHEEGAWLYGNHGH